MPAITPSFLFDFESNVQAIVEDEYARLSKHMWWSKFMKVRQSSRRQEIVAWLLSTAKIEDLGQSGGGMPFEDLVSKYQTFENRFVGAGLKLKKSQLEDLDGNGLELGTKWASDIGAYMGYWPQKQLVSLIKNGHTTTGYDGASFFSASHPLNPFNTGLGNYANLFTGGTAAPIDVSVSADAALANLNNVVASIKGIKMPNGVDPRFLRPTCLIVPPKLQARAVQLTNAKFLAQAATAGGGGGDVEAVIQSFGWDQPIVADELAGFESDTTYFLACEELGASQLGAFVYVDRDPFKITYYTGTGGGTGVDADLDRKDELEWHCKGRNVSGYGHPYLFFKVKAA